MDSNPARERRNARFADGIAARGARTGMSSGLVTAGTLTRVVGLTLEARGCPVALGTSCELDTGHGSPVDAEVVGFEADKIYLMPRGATAHLQPGARVTPAARRAEVPQGQGLLGRVLNADGHPLDQLGRLRGIRHGQLRVPPINPLLRAPVDQPLDVGVRSINAVLSLARGQRIGLFAGAGVGKSSLLGMMTRHTSAEVTVVALIGERGREVQEFVQHTLGEEGLKNAVVVAAPADSPPLTRVRAAYMATAIAEGFRDDGAQVLLLMDSLTRFAQAQREIGLAVGEPPTTRGYPPSVFTHLPQLIERAGNAESGRGSISAIYTVLVEGDDLNDPVGDHARAILDGHIVLSRDLADAGMYPAIDVEKSVSRLANVVQTPEQQHDARELRALISAWRRNQELIAIGAYKAGSDQRTDRALAHLQSIEDFLRQGPTEACSLQQARSELHALVSSVMDHDLQPTA
nr:FliI/YscN family ATPase [Oceanococcus sp. HetDA_MAG_MS8]